MSKKMLGYTTDEWLANPKFWKVFSYSADKKSSAESIKDIFRTKRSGLVQFRMTTKSGEIIHTETHIKVIFDKHGKPVGMRGVTMDITDKQSATEELGQISQRFKNILDGIRDGFMSIDKNWKCLYINDTAAELFQSTKAGMTGKRVIDTTKNFKNFLLYKKCKEAWRTGRMIKFEKFFPHLGKWNAVNIYSSNEGLSVYFVDITTKKQIEEKLTLNEHRFCALIENSSDAISLIDAYGWILYASPSTERVLGHTAKSLMGKNAKSIMHPDDIAGVDRSIVELLAKPGSSTIFKSRYQHKDGSWKWLESVATNLLQESAVKAIVVNYRDVTDRVLGEQRKDEFIGMASHELKTPVTTLKLHTELLQRDFQEQGNAPAAESMQKMNNQIDKLTNLINDLLNLSKIQAGKLELRQEYFNMNHLVHDIVGQIKTISKKHPIFIRGTISKKVYGDRDRIGQALINFLTNAVKYSPASEKIWVILSQKDNKVKVSVKDAGIGIPKDQQEKVFERFYQVDNPVSKAFPGLGIGLYISKQIIKKHQGDIGVKSAQGKGSIFSFSLPIRPAKK